jgi:hypothetical protein
MKRNFDIEYWLSRDAQKCVTQPAFNSNGIPRTDAQLGVSGNAKAPARNDVELPALSDVEVIIQRLESAHTDITSNYAHWRDIGFAFADEFGESGRDYFHRVSRFYPGYSQPSCDKQFDNCLKAKGNGVTIKTFFHLAQQAGISLVTVQSNTNPFSFTKT